MLVTGGSGFIGSHVVNTLLTAGHTVRVMDRIEPLDSRVDWFKGDIVSKQDVHEATRDAEAVFHLAAVADVNVAMTDPETCLTVNEVGTLNLLRACSGFEVEQFILASTVWVYGRADGIVTEETPIPAPSDIYTKTKIGQEHLVCSWCQSHSLPYTILRYDIPYGPGMRSNMAIAAFVRRATRNEPITIYGDGRQGRCWIYITDLAQAHPMVLGEAAKNEIFNLAGNEFVTISEIASLLSGVLGSFPVRHEPSRPSDFVGVRTSIEKARKTIGWSPSTPFADGLLKYVAHVQGSRK